MRRQDLLVIANEAEAEEVARSCATRRLLQPHYPALPLGPVGEWELAVLGIILGVCDGDEKDAVADELLYGEPPGPYVCRVLPEFIDALSRMGEDAILRAAPEWCGRDGLRWPRAKAAALLGRMVAFAAEAKAAGRSVVRFCPGQEQA